TDREAETGEQRGERRGLHAEDLQYRENQQQVQQCAENRREVMRECWIDPAVACEHLAQQARDDTDDPAADDPQDDCADNFSADVDASGHDKRAYGFEIQDVSSLDKLPSAD